MWFSSASLHSMLFVSGYFVEIRYSWFVRCMWLLLCIGCGIGILSFDSLVVKLLRVDSRLVRCFLYRSSWQSLQFCLYQTLFGIGCMFEWTFDSPYTLQLVLGVCNDWWYPIPCADSITALWVVMIRWMYSDIAWSIRFFDGWMLVVLLLCFWSFSIRHCTCLLSGGFCYPQFF